MIPKLKVELNNYYMFLGWVFVIAGLIGGIYSLTGSGMETVLGFALASFLCGLLLIYLGYTKRTVLKRKK